MVNSHGYVRSDEFVGVLSAGPDGVVQTDPGEWNDLSEDPDHAARLDDLRERWASYREALL